MPRIKSSKPDNVRFSGHKTSHKRCN